MSAPLLALESPPSEHLDLVELKKFLARLEDISGLPEIDAHTTSAAVYELPFYPDKDLVVLTNDRWCPDGVRLYFMRSETEVWHLNGSSPAIHEMNARTELVINEANVLEYLAFFCFFVRGEEGPFLILDRPNHMFVQSDKAGHETLVELHRTPRRWKQNSDGDWQVSALVSYSNAVFVADFLVRLDGMIEMLEDHPIAVDLAAKVVAPLCVDEVVAIDDVVAKMITPEVVKASAGFDLWRWVPQRWRKSN